MISMEPTVTDIMRDPGRVLHHRELGRMKIAVMRKLGLYDDCAHWEAGRRLLRAVKGNRLRPGEAVREISGRSGIPPDEVRADLLRCYATGLVEFHPTDVCDVNCSGCHYRNKSNATFPFGRIAELFSNLAPRAATITGGGEPSRYHSQGRTLNDLFLLLRKVSPRTQLGMINNNTQLPRGSWPRHLLFQRSSLDAACADTYMKIKGKNKYDLCVANIYAMLASPIPYVGVGFLLREENIDEMYDFLVDWHARWEMLDTAAQEKFNLQFRVISPATEHVVDYAPSNNLELRVRNAIEKISAQAAIDSEFGRFLRLHSNLDSLDNRSGSYFLHLLKPFRKCHNALLHRVVRADATEFGDFLLCNSPDLALGNTVTGEDPEEERVKIALGTFYYHHCLGPYCNPMSCRQGWVSHIVEKHGGDDPDSFCLPDNYFF